MRHFIVGSPSFERRADGSELTEVLIRCIGHQTDQKSVSPKLSKTLSEPTTGPIRLNGEQKERGKKGDAKRRKEWLRGIESNTKRLVQNIEEAKALVVQAQILHRKFEDTISESLALLENVRYTRPLILSDLAGISRFGLLSRIPDSIPYR